MDRVVAVERRADLAATRRLFDLLPDPAILLGPDNRLVDASASVEELLGWRRADYIGQDVLNLIHPDDHRLAFIAATKMRRTDVGAPIDIRVATSDGSWRYLEVVARNLLDDPEVGGLLVCLRDTTQRRWYELEQDSDERFRLIVQHAAGLLFRLDVDGVVSSVSGGWIRALGHDLEEVVGLPLVRFVAPADRQRLVAELDRARRSRHVSHVEARFVHADGTVLTPYDLAIVNLVDDPLVNGYVVTAHDISALDDARRSLEHLATHDPLTGLANRVLLTSRLRELLADTDGGEETVALLFIDLDGFKQVNDALGHHAGDEVLVRLAERLSSVVQPGDVVARLGGDEFVMVARRPVHTDVMAELEASCLDAVRRPFMLGPTTVKLDGSIGVVVAGYADTPDTLLARADRAMYITKRERRRAARD
jgi:diguanylate cyclase (GGDEF)-like protein/PAS domain S-box-containing protein